MCLASFDETTKGKERIALAIALRLCLATQRHRKEVIGDWEKAIHCGGRGGEA
jgi:hypothetical protein